MKWTNLEGRLQNFDKCVCSNQDKGHCHPSRMFPCDSLTQFCSYSQKAATVLIFFHRGLILTIVKFHITQDMISSYSTICTCICYNKLLQHLAASNNT